MNTAREDSIPMAGGTPRPDAAWVKVLKALIVLALFAVGTWSVPLAVFGPGHNWVPGDLGDGRFNNYVLEHFHQYITGHEPSYWDAPMMYPEKNVIARSDNLLGTAPFYSAFRAYGLERESAFQAWILLLFSLNFWCCFIALREWSKEAVTAACGAFIFAYGIYNQGELPHAQMLPKFLVPLAFLFLWRHLRTGSLWQLIWAALAVVCQTYCGAYLGVMLVYGLFFLLVGHEVAYRGAWVRRFRDRRFLLRSATAVACAGLALLPLIDHYGSTLELAEERTFASISKGVPRLSSLFSSHPAASSWESWQHIGAGLEEPWDHHLFMGGVAWLAVLVAPVLLWRWRSDHPDRRALLAVLIAFVASWAFCLHFGAFSLYELIFRIPGFSGMRSITRIIHVEALFFLLLLMLVLRGAMRHGRAKWAVLLLLPVITVVDNTWDPQAVARFDKYEARRLVERVEMDIRAQRDTSFRAIAYLPVRPLIERDLRHQRTIEVQLTAALAAQALHVPIVNGYSGTCARAFMPFFDAMDPATLATWCADQGIPVPTVQPINNIGEVPVDTSSVWLQAFDGRFVCADLMREGLAIADRQEPLLRETFVHLELPGRRHAFLAYNSDFLCAELEEDGQLSATGEHLGDFGLFRLEDAGDGMVGIRTHRGLYLAVDTATRQVFARDSLITPLSRFRVLPAAPTP